MSTKKTPYYEKVQRGDRMYGPAPKIPKFPDCLSANQIRDKYGDCTPIVKYDKKGNPITRAMT